MRSRRPYFIAEIGLNHNGDVRIAEQLIDVCINAGCDAVKFQKRVVNRMFRSKQLDQPFNRFPKLGQTMREVREALELSADDYSRLKKYCGGKVDFIVTPFDLPSLEFITELGVDAVKIASHSVSDLPLLREVAKTKTPIIASVGMSSEEEIKRLNDTFIDNQLILMHCVSSYPTKIEDSNLGVLDWLRKFSREVGFSDHEDGIFVTPIAVAHGATVIEKHVTLDKKMEGFDHAMSIEPYQLIEVVKRIKQAAVIVEPCGNKRLARTETKVFDERRLSIYAAKDIAEGEVIEPTSLMVRAPLRGLTPRFTETLVGKTAIYDISAGEPITFGLVDFLGNTDS